MERFFTREFLHEVGLLCLWLFVWRSFLQELFATMCYRPLLGLGFLNELRAVQIKICKRAVLQGKIFIGGKIATSRCRRIARCVNGFFEVAIFHA